MTKEYTLSQLKKMFLEKGIEYFVSNSNGNIAEIRFLVKEDS